MLNVLQLRGIFSPLFSILLIIFGTGFFYSYVSMMLKDAGYSEVVIGLVHSSYSLGLVLGALFLEGFILRVGHIRAYAVFAALSTSSCIVMSFIFDPTVWCFMRFFAGVSIAGVYVVVESWLLDKSSTQTRADVLSLYMICFYGAQAVSQFLLDIADLETLQPYAYYSLFVTLSILPLAYTKVETPVIKEPELFNVMGLYFHSPFGFMGTLVSGLILGSIYAFTANFGQEYNLDVAWLMSLTIFGGMIFQWPLGKLSDIYDRRWVLFGMSVATVLPCIVVVFFPKVEWLVYTSAFIIGGLTFTLYPISVAQVCDRLSQNSLTSATGILVLAYGGGAVVGPLISPLFIHVMGYKGLYAALIFFALCLSFFGLITYSPFRRTSYKKEWVPFGKSTPVAYELDPRIQETEEINAQHLKEKLQHLKHKADQMREKKVRRLERRIRK